MHRSARIILVSCALAALLASPPLTASPSGGSPSHDPSHATRLIGGEVLVVPFDSRDLDTAFVDSVLDRSPNAAVLTRIGSPAVVASPGGFGATLYNPGLRLQPADAFNSIANDFSLLTWMRQDEGTTNHVVISSYTSNNLFFVQWYMAPNGAHVRLTDTDGSTTREYSLGPALPAGEWGHVAVVARGASLELYVNGVLASSQLHNPAPYKGAPVNRAGVGLDSGICCDLPGFVGILDELRVYNRSLDASEIASIAQDPYLSPNLAPIADAGPDQVVACTGPATHVPLDGSGSRDPNGDPITFAWESPTAAPLADATSAVAEGTYAIGTHAATLVVSDGELSASDQAVVRVVDFSPPVITATFPDGPGVYAGSRAVHTQDLGQHEVVVAGSLDVSATASDLCSSVASVRFTLDDGTDVVDTEAPFAFTYAPQGLGVQYRALTIIATDAHGNASPPVAFDLTILAASPHVPG